MWVPSSASGNTTETKTVWPIFLRRAGFSAMIRGENVTVDGFIALSNILSEEGEH